MKFLIVFAFALATTSAFDLRGTDIQSRSLVVEPEARITNGQDAKMGQFTYQVGLSLKLGTFKSSWCGGSLIDKQWVLTAAHCTDGIKSATVYLGATERTNAELKYTVSPSDIIIHAGWNSETLENDISLIKIPVTTYTDKIQSVKLPAISSSYSTYAGDKAVASGWGLISDSATGVTNDLQFAPLQVIDNSVCRKTFRIFSSNLCVSTPGGVSTCQGDSGGPLVLESSKVQVGLTSFGALAGCAKGYPAVFTRLTSYLDWIEANTGISY